VVIEQSVLARIQELIKESGPLSQGDRNDQCTDSIQAAACSAWITAAHNAVHLVIEQPSSPYRSKTDRIANGDRGFQVHHAVTELALVLNSLLKDGEAGLLASVADQARAEAFDDFLDHAAHYLRNSKKQEAGVIAGVVFEDSLRRVCSKLNITEKGARLDALITELANQNELTGIKAKRARAAADLRTKATHAQWDEFELDDVRSTIEFTREFIASKLA
jgi:hypothetical protein